MSSNALLQLQGVLASNTAQPIPGDNSGNGPENEAPSEQGRKKNPKAKKSHKKQDNTQTRRKSKDVDSTTRPVATGLVAANDSSSDEDNATANSSIVPSGTNDQLQPPARPASSMRGPLPQALATLPPSSSNERLLQIETGDDFVPASIIQNMPSELSARDAVELYSQICRHLDPEYWLAIIKHIHTLQDSSRAGMEALSRFAEVAYIRVRGLYVLMCSRYNTQLRQWANRNSAKALTDKDLESSRLQLQPQAASEESPAKAHPPTLCVTAASPYSHLSPIPLSPETIPNDGRFTATVDTTKMGKRSKNTHTFTTRQLQLQASEQIATGVLHSPHQPKPPAKSTSSSRRKALPIEYTMVNQALNHADATRELSLEFGLLMPPPEPSFWPHLQTYPPTTVLPQPRIVSMPSMHPTRECITELFQPRSFSDPNFSYASPLLRDPSQHYFAVEDGGTAAAPGSYAAAASNEIGPSQSAQSFQAAVRRGKKGVNSKGKGKADGAGSSGSKGPSPLGQFQPITLHSLDHDSDYSTARNTSASSGMLYSPGFPRSQPTNFLPPPSAGPVPMSHPQMTFSGVAFPWPRGQNATFAGTSAGTGSGKNGGTTSGDANQPGWTQAPTGIYLSRMAVIHGLPFETVATDPFRIYVLILHILRQLNLSQLSHTVRLISTLSALPSSSSLFYGGPHPEGAEQASSDGNGNGDAAASSSSGGKRGWAWVIFNSAQQRNLFLHTYVEKVRAGWLPPTVDSSPGSPLKPATKATAGDEYRWPYYIYSAEDYLGYTAGANRTPVQNHQSQDRPNPQAGAMLPPPVPSHRAMAAQTTQAPLHYYQLNNSVVPQAHVTSPMPGGEIATRPWYSFAAMKLPTSHGQHWQPNPANYNRPYPYDSDQLPPYSTLPAETHTSPNPSKGVSKTAGKKRKRSDGNAGEAHKAAAGATQTQQAASTRKGRQQPKSPAASSLMHFTAQRRKKNTHGTPSVSVPPRAASCSPGSGRTDRNTGMDPGSSLPGTTLPPPQTAPAPAPVPATTVSSSASTSQMAFHSWNPYGHTTGTSTAFPTLTYPHFHTSYVRNASVASAPASGFPVPAQDGDESSPGYHAWWAPLTSVNGTGGGGSGSSMLPMRATSVSTMGGDSRSLFATPGYEVAAGPRMYTPHMLEPYAGQGLGATTTSRVRTPSAGTVLPGMMPAAPDHGGYVRPWTSGSLPTTAYVHNTNQPTPPPPPTPLPSHSLTTEESDTMMMPPPPPPQPASTIRPSEMHLNGSGSGSGAAANGNSPNSLPAWLVRSSSAAGPMNSDGEDEAVPARQYQHGQRRVSFAALHTGSEGGGGVCATEHSIARDDNSSGGLMGVDLSATT
ncbi:hypothetical protein A4X13_0g6941 [Tilletia indica]|uniref:Uncharacterized protein n=1 Tax=Tilletia indica TaxID=43049 RepID=A0A177TY24_9BASI|nr:hypothetical protein A4X13_0g6941 [Tilletia indica]